jgi:hypothetical protein
LAPPKPDTAAVKALTLFDKSSITGPPPPFDRNLMLAALAIPVS